MARLIDADALKEEVEFQQEHMWPEDLSFCIPGMIDNAPTIPAIPVEWLEDRELDYRTTGDKLMSDAFAVVIDDWQKGQEAR